MDRFVSAIILAAGQGKRMGKQKLLLPLGGCTIIERVADAVLASRVAEVITVVGYQADQVTRLLGERPVRLVHNPGYAGGQSTSLVAGVRAIDRRAWALMIVLADQPFLSPGFINRLLEFFCRNSYLIVRPVYEGEPGHPVLMDACLAPELLCLKGDTGARELVARYRERVGLLPVTDKTILQDVDTPQDYRRVKVDYNGL